MVAADRADDEDVSRAEVATRRGLRIGRVAVALAIIPGVLYGVAWLVLGFSGLLGLVRDLCVRALGLVLAASACNCAWHLAKDEGIRRAFLAYIGCFAAVLVLIFALTR
jgi:hypothetical protein